MKRDHALALGIFVALTVAQTWPLASDLSRLFVDHADTLANVWALNELARRLVTDPLNLFDGNIFYPFPNTLAVLDHHLSSAPLAVVARAVDPSPLFSYNLVLLASFVLSGFFTYLLVRRLSGSFAAGLVAGSIFAFSNFRYTHLVHLHVLPTQWLPLTLLLLHGFLERPTWRRWFGLTASGALLGLASWHMAFTGATGVGLVALALAALGGRLTDRRLGLVVLAGAVVAALMVPVLLVYLEVSDWHVQMPEDQRVRNLARHATPLEGFWARGFFARHDYLPESDLFSESRLFPGAAASLLGVAGAVLLLRRRRYAGTAATLTGLFFLGTLGLAGTAVVAAWLGERGSGVVERLRPLAPMLWLLAGLAALWVRRALARGSDSERIALVYLLLVAAGAGLALGPQVSFHGVDLGHGLLPAGSLPDPFRTPARFSVLMVLGLAVLGGLGLDAMARPVRHPAFRAAAAGAVVVLTVADLWPRLPTFERAPGRQAVHEWLARHPDPGAVLEYPITQGHWAVFASLGYDRRLVNGMGALEPPPMHHLRDGDAFTRASLEAIWEHFHPRFIVLRSNRFELEKRQEVLSLIARHGAALKLVARFGPDYVFEVFDQGEGPTLARRWPREALAGARGLEWSGALADVPADVEPVLEVAMNGRVLRRLTGAAAVIPGAHFVPIEETMLVEGINVVELRATYRRRSDAAGADAEGTPPPTADLEVVSAPDGAYVQVNGRVLGVEKGYLVVQLDPETGDVVRAAGFNTSWSAGESDALARFVAGIPEGAPVILASEFDVSRALTPAAVEALASVGSAVDPRSCFQCAHAVVGIKGDPPGSAEEVFGPRDAHLVLGEPRQPVVRLSSLRVY